MHYITYFRDMKMKLQLLIVLFLITGTSRAQDQDSVMIKKIFDHTLTQASAYEWLRHLCLSIPPRLSGSEGAQQAVEYTYNELNKIGADSVWLQSVMVPHWERGHEKAILQTSNGSQQPLTITTLGGSVGTSEEGITANVIQVNSFEEFEKLPASSVKGKIVFFNYPMNPTFYNTFQAYGDAVKYRWRGAMVAAQKGAVAVMVRSMTQSNDDHAHTGSMGYVDSITKIPACALSLTAVETLRTILRKDPSLKVTLIMGCKLFPDAQSYNVIADLRGSEKPEEIIIAGGHLDAWDNGQGAHDDGAGCVQSMQVLKTFIELGIKPKRTIRIILFMNEENGLRGGKAYAEYAEMNDNEKHIAAIESDAGGFSPRGFGADGPADKVEKIKSYQPKLEAFGLHDWEKNWGGADINPLKPLGTVVVGLVPDSQRYFDYHHASSDTFDKINKRELELGAASISSLVYLLAEYGF